MIGFVDIIEFTGTFAFAISGIRLAAAKQVDWFGALVIGFVTAVGGGTLRDLTLDVTPFWMTRPMYILCTLFALIVALLLRRQLARLNFTVFLFDTIGLALFTVVGVEKTLDSGFPFWPAVIMGTITGSVGSIIRDMLVNEIPSIFRKELYATACVAGGLVYWLCFTLALPSLVTQLAAAVAVVAVRLVAVKYQIGMPILDDEDRRR
jgi:uncharacterized membrane protein YeiH